jgi:hypothetical protein
MKNISEVVYGLLSTTPIDIIDENDSDYYDVSTSKRWELINPRENNSTNIGLFNIWMAMVEVKNNFNITNEETLENKLVEVCNILVSKNLLRESPEYKRGNFTVVGKE